MKALRTAFAFVVLPLLLLAACSLFPKHREQTAWKDTHRTMTLILSMPYHTMDGDTMSAGAVAQAVHQRYPEVPFVQGKILDAWSRPIDIGITRAVIDAWGNSITQATPREDRGISVNLRSAGADGIENTADDVIRDCQMYTRGPCPPMPRR